MCLDIVSDTLHVAGVHGMTLTVVDIKLYTPDNVSKETSIRPFSDSDCGRLAMSASAPSMRIFLLDRWASLMN